MTNWRLWSTYHRCSETPLFNFMEAARGNLKALRRKGGLLGLLGLLGRLTGEKTLAEAYGMLLAEYSELCGLRDPKKFTGKEVFLIRLQVMQLREYILIHTLGHNTMDSIRDLCGASSIEEAKSILSLWMTDLETAERRLEKEIGEMGKEGEKWGKGKGSFDVFGLFTEVCRYLCFQLDMRRTTVAEFAGYVVSFNRYVENLDKKVKK